VAALPSREVLIATAGPSVYEKEGEAALNANLPFCPASVPPWRQVWPEVRVRLCHWGYAEKGQHPIDQKGDDGN
jgi:hypothetical protein